MGKWSNPFVRNMYQFRTLIRFFVYLKRPQLPLEILWQESGGNVLDRRERMIETINQMAEKEQPGCLSRLKYKPRSYDHARTPYLSRSRPSYDADEQSPSFVNDEGP